MVNCLPIAHTLSSSSLPLRVIDMTHIIHLGIIYAFLRFMNLCCNHVLGVLEQGHAELTGVCVQMSVAGGV